MADTSFADGDLFIGLGEARSLPSSAGPSTPARSVSASSAGGKKRKADASGSAGKRQKHQPPPPPPRPKTSHELKMERKAKEKQEKRANNAAKAKAKDRHRNAPWADDVEWDECRDPAEMLNEEVRAFYNFMTPTEAEYSVRKAVIETITHHVLKWNPELQVVAFGSWQTQLYLPTGDLDLVVVPPVGQLYSANSTRKFLTNLSMQIRRSGVADKIALVLGAKVPIIKFVTRSTYGNIAVDISFDQSNGISAGKIMTHYLDSLPGSRELITVIKYFLSQRSMNEVFTGGLGSYSVICLVVSFMQMHPKLRRSEMDARRNLGTLLLEFFELYGRSFNYDTVGISLRRGGSYFSKQQRGWTKRGGNPAPFLLSIEDPQNPDNDISAGSYGLPKVKMTFGGAYDMLRQRMFDRAAQILVRDQWNEGANVDTSHLPDEAEEWSILSCVMGVGADTVSFRKHMDQLHRLGRIEADLVKGMAKTGQDVRLQNPPLRPYLAAQEQRKREEMRKVRAMTPSDAEVKDSEVEEGEISSHEERDDLPPPPRRGEDMGAGAIVVDDESDASDGASSHTDDSSIVFNGSVSEDMDLYDTDDADADDSRYAAAAEQKNKRSKAKGKGKGRGGEEGVWGDSWKPSTRTKRDPSDEEASMNGPSKATKANGKASANGNGNGKGKLSIKGAAAHGISASAGPSRTSTPPLTVLGDTANSAPVSPRRNANVSRSEKWVPQSTRAAYWAAKSVGDPIDLTGNSSD